MSEMTQGYRRYKENQKDNHRELFDRLGQGQEPKALFIGCSDSRVQAHLLTDSKPGDIFSLRNVGNLVPCGPGQSENSVGSAIEFAIHHLKVREIIVCGHSNCGAMKALLAGRDQLAAGPLKNWLAHGENSLKRLKACGASSDLKPEDQLSQINVLTQVENLKARPDVKEKFDQGELQLQAWWFDIGSGEIQAYDQDQGAFQPLA